jgi:hypothetical protein
MATVVSNSQAPNKIKHEQTFRSSSRPVNGNSPWSGRPGGADSLGYLPRQYHAAARAARYVVYSYATPIGWVTVAGEHVVPDVGYTLTTGAQQYSTAHAWGIDFRPARGRETVKIRKDDALFGTERNLRSGGLDWQT